MLVTVSLNLVSKYYLLLDENLVNSYTRNDEVGVGLCHMIPNHLVDLGQVIEVVIREAMFDEALLSSKWRSELSFLRSYIPLKDGA